MDKTKNSSFPDSFVGNLLYFPKKLLFFKKITFLRKPYSMSTCVEDRARDRRLSWPLLRVETWLTWLKQSSLRAFSCHWSRPRDIRCIKPSLSFSLCFFTKNRLHVKKYCFLKILSLTHSIIYQLFLCFFFMISLPSIVLQKKTLAESHLLSLFVSLFLFPFFFSFFLLLVSCQGDLMAEDKTRRQENWAKAVVGMATKIWKGGLLLAWFEHDWRSELMDQNQPVKMRRFKCLGKAWQQWCVSCDRVTQTARGTSACEGLSSSLHVSLSVFCPLCVYPLHSTGGKRLAERLGNLRRWSRTQRIKWSASKIQGRSC